jgi:hypothetical protein
MIVKLIKGEETTFISGNNVRKFEREVCIDQECNPSKMVYEKVLMIDEKEIVLSSYTHNGAYESDEVKYYDCVYLMNEKGQTIEKLFGFIA